MSKRKDYIEWDEYFMFSARLAAERSKDPSTQVGSCIVTDDKRIIGSGYNGFCNGISDDILPWSKISEDPLENKHMYVVHSELNSIFNCNKSPKGCTMYTTLYCCSECCKVIIQSGIRKIVYANEPDWNKETYKASKKMFELAGVKIVKYYGKQEIVLQV